MYFSLLFYWNTLHWITMYRYPAFAISAGNQNSSNTSYHWQNYNPWLWNNIRQKKKKTTLNHAFHGTNTYISFEKHFNNITISNMQETIMTHAELYVRTMKLKPCIARNILWGDLVSNRRQLGRVRWPAWACMVRKSTEGREATVTFMVSM